MKWFTHFIIADKFIDPTHLAHPFTSDGYAEKYMLYLYLTRLGLKLHTQAHIVTHRHTQTHSGLGPLYRERERDPLQKGFRLVNTVSLYHRHFLYTWWWCTVCCYYCFCKQSTCDYFQQGSAFYALGCSELSVLFWMCHFEHFFYISHCLRVPPPPPFVPRKFICRFSDSWVSIQSLS